MITNNPTIFKNSVTQIGSRIPKGTSGSIPFIDSNGKLAQDNAGLFWDESNGRQGINNSSPTERLDVSGSVLITNQETAGASGEDASQITTGGPNTKGLIIKGTEVLGVFPGALADWTYRKTITIQNGKVDANLTDFPVFVDLADLGSDFHDNVQADGDDIRITQSDGETKVPVDIVVIDTGGETGEVHFKANSLSSSGDTVFYIYYGNAGVSRPAADSTYGSQNVWDSDCKMVLHLQETGDGSADEYKDSTSNANHGQGGGGVGADTPTAIAGQLGKGQSFDGTNDWIKVNDDNTLDLTNNWTISFWNEWTGAGGQYGFALGKKNTLWSQANGYLLYHVGSLLDCIGKDNGVERVGLATANAMKYFTITMDSSNEIVWYVNGVAQSPSGDYSGGILSAGTDDFWIGKRDAGTGGFMKGTLDEFKVCGIKRESTWISTAFNNQSDTSTFYVVGSQEIATVPQIVSHLELHDADANVNTKFQPGVVDGASAVAYLLDTDKALSTSGYKLLSLKNNGTEKFVVDERGMNVISTGIDDAFGRFGATGTGVAGIYFDASDGDFFGLDYGSLLQFDDLSIELNNRENAPIHFSTDEDKRITITGTGDVGINTITPDAKLQVVGDCKFGDDNTNYVEIGSTGDVVFVGSSGLVFGHAYMFEGGTTVTIASADTWYELTSGLTAGNLNNVTFGGSHYLTVGKAGKYKVVWTASIETGIANQEVMASVTVNSADHNTALSSESTNAKSAANHATIVSANKSISLGGSTILDLSVNDQVSVIVLNKSASTNVVVEHITLTLIQIGG